MKVLLDENFPFQLHRRLVAARHECEHIIVLGKRGQSDADIRARLVAEDDLVFVTQDSEFELLPAGIRAAVVISRIPQRLPIAERGERGWSRWRPFSRFRDKYGRPPLAAKCTMDVP